MRHHRAGGATRPLRSSAAARPGTARSPSSGARTPAPRFGQRPQRVRTDALGLLGVDLIDAHAVTPADSRLSLSRPSRIRPFTVPTGSWSISAIWLCVNPLKYASPIIFTRASRQRRSPRGPSAVRRGTPRPPVPAAARAPSTPSASACRVAWTCCAEARRSSRWWMMPRSKPRTPPRCAAAAWGPSIARNAGRVVVRVLTMRTRAEKAAWPTSCRRSPRKPSSACACTCREPCIVDTHIGRGGLSDQ